MMMAVHGAGGGWYVGHDSGGGGGGGDGPVEPRGGGWSSEGVQCSTPSPPSLTGTP